MSEGFRENATVSRAADGAVVIALHLKENAAAEDLRELLADARNFNARAIWVFGGAIDGTLGFSPTGGYVRLEAPVPPAPFCCPARRGSVSAACRPPASPASGAVTSLSPPIARAGTWGCTRMDDGSASVR